MPGPATSAERVALLRRVPVFSGLTDLDLEAVADVSVPRQYDAGDVVFREGDEGGTCYVVRSGIARAIREHPDGRSITLSHFTAGDIFGELAMFDDQPRSATVDVIEETEVIAIPGTRRAAADERAPRDRRQADCRAGATAAGDQRAACAPVLPDRAESCRCGAGADGGGGARWQRRRGRRARLLTQADLAKLAGSSRESASRFLAALERAGVITQGRGKLTIHDPDALEGYVY